MNMSDVRIKVDTGFMLTKAEAIKTEIRTMRKDWEQIQKTVKDMKGYWEGDASNKNEDILNKEQEEVEEVMKRLSEHPDDLLKMANLYSATETNNEEDITALPSDIIT